MIIFLIIIYVATALILITYIIKPLRKRRDATHHVVVDDPQRPRGEVQRHADVLPLVELDGGVDNLEDQLAAANDVDRLFLKGQL